MWLVTLLIFLAPIAVLVLVFFAIGAAAGSVYRSARRVYFDVKPLIDDLTDRAGSAQKRVEDITQRGTRVAETFEEISGRVAFISEVLQETTSSPVSRLADIAGRFAGGDAD